MHKKALENTSKHKQALKSTRAPESTSKHKQAKATATATAKATETSLIVET
jgi:hypothetical protein